MWVHVQVRVDAISQAVPQGQEVVGLATSAWVESEKLPPVPDFAKGIPPARDYKLVRLVVWPNPNGARCVTLFGAWTHEPGGLIADKWAEGDVT